MGKKRILHLVPGLDAGGIEMMLLNYYKHMDRSKFQFDFAMFFNSIGMTGKEFINMGSKIYHLTPKSKSLTKYRNDLLEIFNNNIYDIVHAHQNYMSFIPLYIAKEKGISVRIAHSHSTSVDKSNIFNPLLRKAGIYFNNKVATHRMSCGIEAGKYIFGEKNFNEGKVIVVPNAIETKKFSYSQIKREQLRNELNIKDKFVIGHIGRLSEEKNQTFLLDVFKEVYEKNNDACLVIVGEGDLEEYLRKRAKELKIEKQVYFLGRRNDVNELLNIFDIFVLPSLQEGFPVVCIEAQASGVKCIFSDKVPKEVSITDLTEFVSLDRPIKFWAEKIEKASQKSKRFDYSEKVKESGYDIQENAKWLEQFYIDCLPKEMEI
jgi:glycosyltransferase involved in cell wall biosynthesis